jgi:hypothetical protein
MIVGFNHNVVYKGEVFHVQTEDSGVNNPHIITLLYRGGVILSSKKTSYADILKMDNFESVVEELMKAQHKEMMRRLKSGEFDERAFSIEATLIENYEIQSPEPEAEPAPAAVRNDGIFSSPPATSKSSSKSDLSMLFEMPLQKAASAATAAAPPVEKPVVKEAVNLDDAILNFFGANEKK